MKYLLWAILIYVGYRFITGFLWPVYKATRLVKQQFKTMQQHMQQEMGAPAHEQGMPQSEKPRFDLGGEYIQYEEIQPK